MNKYNDPNRSHQNHNKIMFSNSMKEGTTDKIWYIIKTKNLTMTHEKLTMFFFYLLILSCFEQSLITLFHMISNLSFSDNYIITLMSQWYLLSYRIIQRNIQSIIQIKLHYKDYTIKWVMELRTARFMVNGRTENSVMVLRHTFTHYIR